MRYLKAFLVLCLAFACPTIAGTPTYVAGQSVYQLEPADPEAVYFKPGEFSIRADGKTDVSDELQKAIYQVKTRYNFGIVFIPEGKYLISKTIYVPQAVRLIGYGKKRPEIILASKAPGFQQPDQNDKGKAKYMFWFTSGIPQPGRPVPDAGAGTFYSAMANINLRISDGNPAAVALRTHYAQHSFIEYVDVYTGEGYAGMFDVGNEMANVRFFGGEYGIYTFKPSPGWQFVMVDTYFEGQRKAAIRTQEAGLTIIRTHVKNTPTVVETNPDHYEKLFMEDSRLENISGPALVIANEGNAYTQISLRNVECSRVPVLARFRNSEQQLVQNPALYRIQDFNYGLQMDALDAKPVFTTRLDIKPIDRLGVLAKSDIPVIPDMDTWVNLRRLGAKGDGLTDDTKIIQEAIDQYPVVFVPQGWYRVSNTLKMRPGTVLIGLNPISTQFIIRDNETLFGSFGAPKPLLESSAGGNDFVSGIGLFTGASNPRAVGCKWMAGSGSYLNDVKFVGGHGTMSRPQARDAGGPRPPAQSSTVLPGKDALWDTQYWSLWVTSNGGGTFKNIWSANTYASSGFYVNNTSASGRIYAMSVEHHVRNEARFKNVSNWKVYALQLEEESRESSECQPLDIENTENVVFANLYMFRVIRVNTPYPYSIRSANNRNVEFLNVHNYSQVKYTTNLPLYDVNANIQVRPWEFNRLLITGKEKSRPISAPTEAVKELVKGFEFADGITSDSKGNIFFSESRMRRIYKWSALTETLSLVADFPWEPLSLATDLNDNLLVVFKYVPRAGYLVDGKPESFPNPPDAAGTSFSGWGNSGFGTLVYSIDPEQPEETIRLLDKVPVDGLLSSIQRTWNPSNRRRDSGDFNKVSTNRFSEYWLAPDRATAIPLVYDLARSNSLALARPGQSFYGTDEYLKRTVRFDVAKGGYLSGPAIFAEKGEFCSAVDTQGNVYIADGQIYVYSPAGQLIREIETPERPSTITFGGSGNTLYITGRNSLYSVKVK